MRKHYEKPLFYLSVSKGDVIVMSEIAIDLSDTGWGNYDEGGIL